ncbi:MAG TPA: hypothetical protein VGR19_07590 [Allosphingosinicella sp.]|nr:hypothetical protein [Allosphingosinicella sp.]
MVASESFANFGALLAADPPLHSPISNRRVTATDPAPITFAYDAPSRSYSIVAGPHSTTYGPAQLQNFGHPLAVRYQHGPNDILFFERQVQDGAIELLYVAYGFWAIEAQGTYFVHGIATPPAQLPTAGSGNYRLDGFARLADDSRVREVTLGLRDVNLGAPGPIIRVDFATRAVSVSVVFNEIGETRGTGTFDGATGIFQVPLSGGNYSGVFRGRFFGPNAIKAGGSVTLRNNSGDALVASLAGKSVS